MRNELIILSILSCLLCWRCKQGQSDEKYYIDSNKFELEITNTKYNVTSIDKIMEPRIQRAYTKAELDSIINNYKKCTFKNHTNDTIKIKLNSESIYTCPMNYYSVKESFTIYQESYQHDEFREILPHESLDVGLLLSLPITFDSIKLEIFYYVKSPVTNNFNRKSSVITLNKEQSIQMNHSVLFRLN